MARSRSWTFVNDHTEETLALWRQSIDAELVRIAPSSGSIPARLRDAIRYSLTGEGKRLRGLLLMASYEALGGRQDASALAAAVEVVHAYSLVHDDLPCMDNDSIRRGRATTHRAFDVSTATIAGVIMVPLAVQQTIRASRALALSSDIAAQLVATLMQASGAGGMVGGQLLDLAGEGRHLSVAELEAVHDAKTGALIAAAVTMGGIAASGAPYQVAALRSAGQAFGLAFQIADDVLDATASTEALGKTARLDAALSKSTYASALGIAAARSKGESLVDQGVRALQSAKLRTPHLERLARFVAARGS
jgi:geranylgeranyl diphosphate synthase type II